VSAASTGATGLRPLAGDPGEGKRSDGHAVAESNEFPAPPDVSTPAGPLILLVEDDPRFVTAIQLYLQHMDYQVAVATSGPEGLERYLELRPDLLVVDNALPRMMGHELVAHVRRREGGAEVPIILTSGYDRMIGLDEEDEPIVDLFLTKPFLLGDLVGHIAELLDRESPAGQTRLQQRQRAIGEWRRRRRNASRTPLPETPLPETERRLRSEMEIAAARLRRSSSLGDLLPQLPAAPDFQAELGASAEGDPDSGPHANGWLPPQAPPASASLQEIPPAELLARCLTSAASGFLRVKGSRGAFSAVLRRGIPCYLETADLEESFARFLNQQGYLSEELFQQYAEQWHLGRRPPPARFVQDQRLELSQLKELLERYLHRQLGDFLAWTSGTFAFQPDEAIPARWPKVAINPVETVYTWVCESHDEDQLGEALQPSYERHLRLLPVWREATHLLQPLLTDQSLLLPGLLPVVTFLGTYEADFLRGLRVLRTLLLLGVVEAVTVGTGPSGWPASSREHPDASFPG